MNLEKSRQCRDLQQIQWNCLSISTDAAREKPIKYAFPTAHWHNLDPLSLNEVPVSKPHAPIQC